MSVVKALSIGIIRMRTKQLVYVITPLLTCVCCFVAAGGEASDKAEVSNEAQDSQAQAASDSDGNPSKAADSSQKTDNSPQDDNEANVPLAGHSEHGDAYNEGPRQNAYLMGGTGKVDFPVTTNVADAQAFFTQGVGQLHGFWYYEAERSFRRVESLDPNCAMAYWGMAQANRENKDRAKAFITEAVEKKEGATRREQMYIDALHKFLTDGKK